MAKGHIFIGVPTADQTITTGTTKSIYRLTLALQKIGVSTSLFFAESADIIENRNILAAYFLETDASHLLFIDSDISFDPQTVGDFIGMKKPIVGSAYPKRKIDLRRFAMAYDQLDSIKSPEERFRAAQARASQFPFMAKHGARVNKGFVLADAIPAGLMLTERRVFTSMIKNKDKAALRQLGPTPLWPQGGHYGFFDRVWIPKHKYWLSEDLSFCHRWVQGLGEEIYAYIGPGVTHHGNMGYDANYLDFAKNRQLFEQIESNDAADSAKLDLPEGVAEELASGDSEAEAAPAAKKTAKKSTKKKEPAQS